jgi:hypothetical protein
LAFVKGLITGPEKNKFKAQAAFNNVPNWAVEAGQGNSPLAVERQNFNPAINTGLGQQAAGFQGQANTAGRQASFADMLQQQAMGNGPSLANLQLMNATARNNAMLRGQLGSQKGISPALAARTAALAQNQSGADLANQSAQIRAQEQLNAQGLLGNALQAQRGQDIQSAQLGQGLMGTGIQGQAEQNQTMLGLNQLRAQGDLANQAAKMQEQQINSGIQQGNVDASNAATGAVLQAAGTVGGAFLGGHGKAHGGEIGTLQEEAAAAPGHMSFAEMVARHLTAHSAEHFAKGGQIKLTAKDVPPIDKADIGQILESGQTGVDVAHRPGLDALQGRPEGKAMGGVMHMYDAGGHVPGQAPFDGDDDRNDIVPAMLSPGEVVLPRSVAHDPEKSKRFVEHIRAQTPTQYGDIKRRR